MTGAGSRGAQRTKAPNGRAAGAFAWPQGLRLEGQAAALQNFAAQHRVEYSVPISIELPNCDWQPIQVLEALHDSQTVFLFETPGGPPDLERRTFLTWDPEVELVFHRDRLEIRARGQRTLRQSTRQPLHELRRFLARNGAQPTADAAGFTGGLVGYVAYDFKNYLERLPNRVEDDLATPELRFALSRHVLAWDHRTHAVRLCVNVRCRSRRARVDFARGCEALERLQAEIAARLQQHAARINGPASGGGTAGVPHSNRSRAAYHRMLARAHEYILNGDIYQANISHRFEATYSGSGVALYRHLRRINPSPFATYLRFADQELVSCSPERLVRLQDGQVETRPIAGTRPRGLSLHADEQLERELCSNEKEQAEHVMIVDMARNDLGRVCRLGSVEVESFMHVERYSHVRHLVSNVVGRLRADADAFDVLAATFPGASITGVPKIRCMQIIDELEGVRRGVYTGSAGYIGLDGRMDFNILIRTVLLQGGRAYWGVGGGIVADSDPDREYAETLAKGGALHEALAAAARPDHPRSRLAELAATEFALSRPLRSSGE